MNRSVVRVVLTTLLLVLSACVVLSTATAPAAKASANVPPGDLTLVQCGTTSPCTTGSIAVNYYSTLAVVVSTSGTSAPSAVTVSVGGSTSLRASYTVAGVGGIFVYTADNVTNSNTTGTATVTWSGSSVSWLVWFANVINVPTIAFDQSGGGATGTGTNISATAQAATVNDYTLMSVVSSASSTGQAYTPGAGQSQRSHNSIVSNQVYFGEFTVQTKTSGSYPLWVTDSVSSHWIALIVSFLTAGKPGAPTSLTVASTTMTTVHLTWTPPSGPVVNYVVSQALWTGAACGSYTVTYSVGPVVAYVVSGLSSGYAVCFEVTAYNASQSASVPSTPVTDVTGAIGTVISLYGNQAITTAVAYRNDSVTVYAGNITITGSGCLTIDNSTVKFTQNETGNHVDVSLMHGLKVNAAGACLIIKYSTVKSANGTTVAATDYQSWVDDNLALNVSIFHSTLQFLGEVNSTPTTSGVDIDTADVSLSYDLESYVYQTLFSGTSATGDSVIHTYNSGGSGFKFNNSLNVSGAGPFTINDTPAVVQCTLGCSHFTMTNSSINASTRFALTYYSSGNYIRLAYDYFTANYTIQAFHGLMFVGKPVDSEDSSFVNITHDTIQGGDIYFNTHAAGPGVITQWINITNNILNHTSFEDAIRITGTNNVPADIGTFIEHVRVLANLITNYSDGIKLVDNVSLFNVSGNRVVGSDNTGGTAYDVQIYLARHAQNGTVWDNYVDGWDASKSTFYSNPIDLEAGVRNVNVSFNQIRNFTQAGITDQGGPANYTHNGISPWGASEFNSFYKNTLINPVSLVGLGISGRKVTCFLSWDWGNDSVFKDNTCQQTYVKASQGEYAQAGVYDSSFGNQYINNTFTNIRYGAVIHIGASNQEWNGIGVFNASYDQFINNTFINTTLGTYTIDNSMKWPGVTDVVAGDINPAWTFVVVNATVPAGAGKWILSNPVYNYSVGASADIYGTNKTFTVGPIATLTGSANSYALNITSWKYATPEIVYGEFNATVSNNLTKGWYNETIGTYALGGITWLASAPAGVTLTYTFRDVTVGDSYTFYVGDTDAGSAIATVHGVTFVWNGSTSPTALSIGIVPPLPPPTGEAVVALILGGSLIAAVGGLILFYGKTRGKSRRGPWGD